VASPEADPDLVYRHPRSGEASHDRRDPVGEARETFVEPALAALGRVPPGLRILEIGFGRGLNTAAALRALAGAGARRVLALGLEPGHPALEAPWPPAPPELAPWAPWWGRARGAWRLERDGLRARGCILGERAGSALARSGASFDLVFLDLFSPGRHPEDWDPGLEALLAARCRPGAVLTTYCCARRLREALAAAGWRVERRRRRGRKDALRAVLEGPLESPGRGFIMRRRDGSRPCP